jgi:hypothetical protein
MCETGKKAYPNGASAMREARKLSRWNRGTNRLRCYLCPACGQYHLANSINRRAGNAQVRRFCELRQGLHGE